MLLLIQVFTLKGMIIILFCIFDLFPPILFHLRRGPSSLAGKSKITNSNESDHFWVGPRSHYSSSIIDFDCFFVSRPSFPQTESEIEIDEFVLYYYLSPTLDESNSKT
jgi:hypothetical protein